MRTSTMLKIQRHAQSQTLAWPGKKTTKAHRKYHIPPSHHRYTSCGADLHM